MIKLTTNNTVEVDAAFARPPSYPMEILRAIAAAYAVPELQELSASLFRGLYSLITKIDVSDPARAIYATRFTLAKDSNTSVESISRLLRWLEKHSFITRQQKSRPGLRGSDGLIFPSKKLLKALFIGYQYPNAKPPTSPHPSFQSVRPEQTLTPPPQFNDRDTENQVRIQGKSVPADLADLVQAKHLTLGGLFKLMSIAKRHGKRLSDVVAVVRPALANARNVYSYLLSLIKQDKDYSALVKQEQDATAEQHQHTQEKALVQRKAEEWIGQCFEASEGDTSRFTRVTENGYLEVCDRATGRVTGSDWISLAFVQAVQDGRLIRAGSALAPGPVGDFDSPVSALQNINLKRQYGDPQRLAKKDSQAVRQAPASTEVSHAKVGKTPDLALKSHRSKPPSGMLEQMKALLRTC